MLKSDTAEIQSAFAAYCRTGRCQEIEGIQPSRIHHYKRLVFNVFSNTVKQAYPIAREILSMEQWNEMIDSFLQNHDSKTPKIWELPFEFLQFVKKEKYADQFDIPALEDLLLLEWAEIEAHTMPDEEIPPLKATGDVLEDILVVNPEKSVLRLSHPVHKYAVKDLGTASGDFFVVCYRIPESGRVRFIEMNLIHIYTLNRIVVEDMPVSAFLDEIIENFRIKDKELLTVNLRKFLMDMLKQKVILGYRQVNISD